MKFQWFFVLILSQYCGHAQIFIKEQLPNGEFETIDYPEILKVPEYFIDSLVLNALEIPYLPEHSEDRHLSGTLVASYLIENEIILESKVERGIGTDLDSALKIETDKIFGIFRSNLEWKPTEKYRAFVCVQYRGEHSADTIFIDTTGGQYKFPKIYTVARKMIPLKGPPEINLNENVVLDKNPKNLDECIEQLDLLFDDKSKENIKEGSESDFSVYLHPWLGMNLRNYWGLWGGSELSQYFNKLGVYHPDDMTGIIFDSYYRHITGKPLLLEEQIQRYKDWWEKSKKRNEERE